MTTMIDPARHAAVITPHDTTNIGPVRGVYVGGAGNMNVTMESGATVLFSGIPAGTTLPIRVTTILSTSTTATLIVALY